MWLPGDIFIVVQQREAGFGPRTEQDGPEWRSRRGPGLRGAAEVCIYRNIPGFEQPFWDVTSVLVLFAPFAQLGRDDVVFWRESQLPNLHFEFRTED